jgi:Tfp pilus assembly protein PilN
MINLLPPKHADSIRYGRQNTVLRNWLIGLGCAIGGLIIILVGGWLYINQQTADLQKNINVTDQELKAQNQSQIQKDAKEIRGDITVINKVLSQEIRFSELIKAMGNVMPPGTVLGSLSLSNKVSGALDLSASAKDYTSAAQVAVNLSDPSNQLFSKVDIVNISCDLPTNTSQTYKCAVSLRALFSKTAQQKFLNAAVGSKS